MVTARSPTLTTLLLFAVVFVVEAAVEVLGLVALWRTLFVLAPPVTVAPWTVLTSVYAHAGTGHLLANAAALLVPGFVLERSTTGVRYHAFFVGSGAVAGVAEITLGSLLGAPSGVLGASGAVFAVVGYVLSANRLADAVVGGVALSARSQLVGFGLLAVIVTAATGAPGVALVAHFTGLFVGLVAGRLHLLRPRRSATASGPDSI